MADHILKSVDERVLVCAPTGRDASLAAEALATTGLPIEVCPTVEDACEQLRIGAAVFLVANEALTSDGQELIARTLLEQPTWSDIPVLILTSQSTTTRDNSTPPLPIVNTTLIERPVRRAVLVSAIQTAMRARLRQYEVRDHLAERERHAAELREAAQREHALRTEAQSARERLETVLLGIADGLFILDSQWRHTYVNAAAGGVAPDAVIGRTVWEIYPELIASNASSHLNRVMDERTPAQFDWYRSETGLWYHWRVYPAPEGVAVFSADATERKNAEQATRQYLERQENIAETLQRSLLSQPRSYPGIDIASHYEAAYAEAKIGGDFYDEFLVDDYRLALVVGDVVGKGLAAATHTAEVKYALRAFLREDPRPNVAMERLNNFLVESQRLTETEEDKLVAVVLVVWNLSSHALSVSVAAAEPPLIAAPTGEVFSIEAGGPVVGAYPKCEYPVGTAKLEPGHAIVMLTDGITEARRGHVFFGLEGAMEALRRRLPGSPFEDLGPGIIADAKAFAGGSLKDDACILLARRIQ